MPKFSKESQAKLATCISELQLLFNNIIRYRDCTIVEGHRTQTRQNELFKLGKSKLRYPHSKHNVYPSLAVDVAPYTGELNWNQSQCYYFAGYVIRMAEELNIPIRWGGDWDTDHEVTDQNFNDLVHFELIN